MYGTYVLSGRRSRIRGGSDRRKIIREGEEGAPCGPVGSVATHTSRTNASWDTSNGGPILKASANCVYYLYDTI